jgi:hypothetical protein
LKKFLLLFSCILVIATNAQNGFTTYTTNLNITGSLKLQTAFLVDNNSNKWIGFRTLSGGNAGLVKYDNTTWTLYNQTSSPAFPSNRVTSLAKDNSGNIWIGCDSGLVKFDGTSFTTYNTAQGLPTKLVNCVEVVGNQVYVGTNLGLSRFDGVAFTNYNVAGGTLPANQVTCIKSETPNLLWLGGNNSMVEFNINNAFTITSFTNHTVVSSGLINCIYIDSQNAKWLGTTTQGILKYNGLTFVNANTLYQIFGSEIPGKVLDIAAGVNGGIAFVSNSTSGVYNAITELAQNNAIFQYFYLPTSNNFGSYIENDGTNLLINVGGLSQSYNSTNKKMYHSFNKTNYTTQLGIINNNNFKTLDINNVKAGIANRSDMHWDLGGQGNAMYEVPKGIGKCSSHASALWIGGLDNGGQLHSAAQTYRQAGSGGVNFWPGPLDTITATIDTVTAVNYDKIWKVSYTDVNTFINAFNSGSVVATPDMLSWPAHGTGNNARNLAPFVDYNLDGLYNPNDGDYPKIKGDQTLYFIYNDNLAAHSNSFTPMGIEVQGMAYAYGCPTVLSGKPELSYTTFYDYKITNRSSNNYHDVFVSMWSDVDLGYYGDDFIGSNVADNYGYAYNADGNDETTGGVSAYGSYMPAQGYNIVKGPIANVMDGIDNNNNGTIDEIGEDCKMNKFSYFNNSFAGVPWQVVEPSTGQEYYNYMTGYWKDGTSFTCGGNAYGGTVNTNWTYSGDPNNLGINTDVNNTCDYWTETSAGNTPGDRRLILSSGPFTLNAGQMQEVEYAFVTSFDSSSTTNLNLLSVAKLKTDIQKVNAFYNQINKPNCLQAITVGITQVAKQNDFVLYPNPAKSLITISSTINGTVKINYEIVDVLGKVILQNENSSSDKFIINIHDLNSGIYFLRLHVNNSFVVKKFVKE